MTNRLTILQVLPALGSGGVERGTVDVARAVVKAGGTALVASAGGPMVREIERAGGVHVTLPLTSKAPYRIWRNAALLAQLIAERQVSIVHARSRAPAWSAMLAARRAGVPFVTTFHGTYNFKGRLKKRYNSIMARGDRVIAISRFIYRHVQETYGVDESMLRLVPRGIDTTLFNPAAVSPERIIQLAERWRVPHDQPTILMAGRITRWKGQEVLLEALHRLGRPDMRCLIVGGADGHAGYRRELDRTVERLRLGPVVHFTEQCNDMPAAYMLANVVVHASTDPEAFGRVVAEAQAMGKPVVASDLGAPPEIVIEGRTGWLVRAGDPDDLADALRAALSLDPLQRRYVMETAIAHIRENFTVEAMCDATLAVYEELLAQG